eukprot:1004156-Pyramimonas_sp.AAC.1
MMNIAVVGGGITGALVASELANDESNACRVFLFDQGRRGPGGRASHRSVKTEGEGGDTTFVVEPDDEID